MIQITSKWTTESAGRYLVEPCSVEIPEGWAFRVDAEWFHPETGGIQVLHLVSNIRRLGKQWLFNVRLKDKLVLHCSFDKTIWDAKCQKKISQLLLEKRYRVLREKCVFRKNLQYFANWAAIGCPKNGQPIRMTVQSHYFDYFESLLQRYVNEGWVAEDCEKNPQFFLSISKKLFHL